ncbi:MAG: hypothetical protein ACOCRX_11820, partial [Candidatus Woesearchaeota archaeon]
MEKIKNNLLSSRVEFLNKLFKDLSGFIEIAELKNGKMTKKYYDSIDKLEEYDPPKDKDVFFGVFTRRFKSGKIEAVNKTKAIWLDFDDIEE